MNILKNLRHRILRTFFGDVQHFSFNTRVNKIDFAGIGATSFDPTPDFVYGFKAEHESVTELIETDRALLRELGITHKACAQLIEEAFSTKGERFHGAKIIRWTNIHSPICPFDADFCTKSSFDLTPTVTEIWLCHPEHEVELTKWFNSLNTNGYPIEDLKRFVDLGWIIVFSDLHPHLIREHHFFEGHGTPYRVNPRILARMI